MKEKSTIVIGASLKIVARYNLKDSYGNEVQDLDHYEVIKRNDDGKVSIVPTKKPLTK